MFLLEADTEIMCLAISQYKHLRRGMAVENPAIWCMAAVPSDEGHFIRVGLAKWDVDAWERTEKFPVMTFCIR